MKKNEKIIRRFVENSLNVGVVGAGYVNPTSSELESFFNAKAEVGEEEYQRISADETERFKKKHDL